ncbi:unnamed protein product [Paramecium octaurelia]|uniref:Uncharacterized protein n=1 Tax=Paramecium octaurelia TaxID=43137 RepID=A0A8S1YN59_PAROT|nr:unnamed protein product [Paramecium octaurelia]
MYNCGLDCFTNQANFPYQYNKQLQKIKQTLRSIEYCGQVFRKSQTLSQEQTCFRKRLQVQITKVRYQIKVKFNTFLKQTKKIISITLYKKKKSAQPFGKKKQHPFMIRFIRKAILINCFNQAWIIKDG